MRRSSCGGEPLTVDARGVGFVYVIAFSGERFVMVRHRERSWEMPGGRLEENESFETAAAREFREETGLMLTQVGCIDIEGGKVVVGLAGDDCPAAPLSEEVREVRLFDHLPDDLSFPLVEYQTMLRQAKTMVESFKRKKGIDAPASPQAKHVDSER